MFNRLYEEYPKVLAVFDSETESELTEKECAALIEVMELKNKLTDMGNAGGVLPWLL